MKRVTNICGKMNRWFIATLLVTLLYSQSAFSADDKVRFEIMKKSYITLPKDVTKILVADNFITPKAYRYHEFIYNNRPFVDKSNIDSLLSISAIDGFRNVIYSSDLYNVNETPVYFSPNDTSRCKLPIDRKVAVEMMNKYEAQSMLVLHDIDVIDVLEIEEAFSYYVAKFVIYYVSSWKRYDIDNTEYISYNFKADTVNYESFGNSEDNAIRYIPDRYTAMGYAAYKAGQEMAKLITPHWETVEREYYTFNIPELMPANTLLKEGNIKNAVEIWKANSNIGGKSMTSKIAFNIAVACEMLDRLEIAIEWIDKSIALKPNNQNKKYKSILQKRITDREFIYNLYESKP